MRWIPSLSVGREPVRVALSHDMGEKCNTTTTTYADQNPLVQLFQGNANSVTRGGELPQVNNSLEILSGMYQVT